MVELVVYHQGGTGRDSAAALTDAATRSRPGLSNANGIS